MRPSDYIAISAFHKALSCWTCALLLQSSTLIGFHPSLHLGISSTALILVFLGILAYVRDPQTRANRTYREAHAALPVAEGSVNLVPKVHGFDAVLFHLHLAKVASIPIILVLAPGTLLAVLGLKGQYLWSNLLNATFVLLAILCLAGLSYWIWYFQRRQFWALFRRIRRDGPQVQPGERHNCYTHDPFSRHLLLMACRFSDLSAAAKAFKTWDAAYEQAESALGNQLPTYLQPFIERLRRYEEDQGVSIIRAVDQFALAPEASPYERMMFYAAAREHYEPAKTRRTNQE